MNALEMHESLDRALQEIKAAHAEEMQVLKDRLMVAELDATVHKDQCLKALADRDRYMRIATELVTQFATVEAVFAKARALALRSGFMDEGDGEPGGDDSAAMTVLKSTAPGSENQEQDDTSRRATEEPKEPPAVQPGPNQAAKDKRLRQALAAA